MALKKFAVVSTQGLHLRVDADRSSAWRDKLSKGDRVEVLEGRAGWLFVRVERTAQRGWVYAEHVKLETPKPDLPEEPEHPPLPSSLSLWEVAALAVGFIITAIALTTCIGP